MNFPCLSVTVKIRFTSFTPILISGAESSGMPDWNEELPAFLGVVLEAAGGLVGAARESAFCSWLAAGAGSVFCVLAGARALLLSAGGSAGLAAGAGGFCCCCRR